MTELQSISQLYSVSFDHSQFYIEVDPVRILNYVLAAIAIHIYTLLTVHKLQKKKKIMTPRERVQAPEIRTSM